MSYQDELKEQARKRARRNYRNKMFLLVIFLIVVLFLMHFLGKKSEQLANSQKTELSNNPTQTQQSPARNK